MGGGWVGGVGVGVVGVWLVGGLGSTWWCGVGDWGKKMATASLTCEFLEQPN